MSGHTKWSEIKRRKGVPEVGHSEISGIFARLEQLLEAADVGSTREWRVAPDVAEAVRRFLGAASTEDFELLGLPAVVDEGLATGVIELGVRAA